MMFSDDELDTYASVSERDVDLVVVVALRASPVVRQLFAKAAGLESSDLVSVRHSVATHDGREADMEVRLGDPERPYVVQIENKLDAQFQLGHRESYAQRAAELTEQEGVATARAVLVCPRRYAESTDPRAFDGLVAYEELRDLLAHEGEWGREAALLLEHAIEKHRRGGSHSPEDPHRTRFFSAFSALAAEKGLPPVPPRSRKGGAGFLWWPRDGTLKQPKGWTLPNATHGAWLAAKFIHGHADIELTGLAVLVDVEGLEAAVRSGPVEMEAKRNSVRFRIHTRVLDLSKTVIDQVEDAAEFVEALVKIRDWWTERGIEIVERAVVRGR